MTVERGSLPELAKPGIPDRAPQRRDITIVPSPMPDRIPLREPVPTPHPKPIETPSITPREPVPAGR